MTMTSNFKKMLPVQLTSKRQLTGMKKCNQDGSPTCPNIHHSKEVKSSITKETFLMEGQLSCLSKGVIYITTCTKCIKQYVGKTGRKLKEIVYEHRNAIHNKNPTSTREHFNIHHQ